MMPSASSMEAPVQFTVDQIASIFPGYQVHHLIGAGGMGAVYQATQLSLDRLVAIKILPPEFVRNPALRAMFAEEAKAMARLNHPNLIAVHDFGEIGDTPYIIMEYVHGSSLHHSARGTAIDPAEVIRIIMGVCAGLAYAHQIGVIHCDIKPANILLTQQVQPKIGDFGLARRTGPSESANSPTFGSEHYSAPEIIQQSANVDARADVYSTGIILHELLTGRRPADDPRCASALCRCDPRFDAIIKRATMPDPALRYAGIQEMTNALAEIRAISAAAKAAAGRKQQARTVAEKPKDPPAARGSSATPNTAPPKSSPKSKPKSPKSPRTLSRSGLWMAFGLVGLLGLVAAIGTALKRPSPDGVVSQHLIASEPPPQEPPAVTPVKSRSAGEVMSVEFPGGVMMKFCYCPPGSFMMGSPPEEKDRNKSEDQVNVKLSQGYWMARTECTQAQWIVIMGGNPSQFKGDELPVEMVSWNDAQQFITKLNEAKTLPAGWKAALPSEAQWEYACRAGTTGDYAGTLADMAWYDLNSDRKTHPVGTKQVNEWGLCDMHGNVWEWCEDWYAEKLPGGTDPMGVTSGSVRVDRGGSWRAVGAICRSAYRSRHSPDNRFVNLGFRVALLSVPAHADPTATAVVPAASAPALAASKNPAPGQETSIKLPRGVEMKFCGIPSGSFQMGSPPEEKDRGKNEDQVDVTLSQGYWLAQTECTQAQWMVVMGGNPSQFKADDLPVEKVSWNDARQFIAKLNDSKTLPAGWKAALPTEAQWEYACRAGTTTTFGFGETLDTKQANFAQSLRKTCAVATYPPNAWGIHDMHGNVGEWCEDWHAEILPGGNDPVGATSGELRVIRGGSWSGNAHNCRAAKRNPNDPTYTNPRAGFRVALIAVSGPADPAAVVAAAPAVSQNPAAGQEMSIKLPGGVEMKFCGIPPGSFVMGSPPEEPGRRGNEDQVDVKLSQGFWLARTECTQAQWAAVMGNNPSEFKGDDLPVEKVSWNDAQVFITKLNDAKTLPAGWMAALPTEAQWEYACRAGTKTAYSFGETINATQASFVRSLGKTSAVASYPRNAWGLYDMHGNVWEWCQDWYGDKLPAGTDPTGVTSGVRRICRGGSWFLGAGGCRAAIRWHNYPVNSYYDGGIRVALIAVP